MKTTLATLLVLISLMSTAMGHMALLYPKPRGGYGTPQYNGHVHTWIGYKDKTWKATFPCGGFRPGPETTLKAGQVVAVRFAASSMSEAEMRTQPKPNGSKRRFPQARHGGGTCEFSLSYDEGKTFHLIGRYTRSCPDAYYEWPVKIPSNVPSCTKKTRCLFVWSWTASILPQYYHNCADVSIEGVKNGKLPNKSIKIVDFAGHQQGITAPGDNADDLGKGPSRDEINANLHGKWD